MVVTVVASIVIHGVSTGLVASRYESPDRATDAAT